MLQMVHTFPSNWYGRLKTAQFKLEWTCQTSFPKDLW